MKQTNPFSKLLIPLKKLVQRLVKAEKKMKRNNSHSHVPFRLNFLFFVIFALFGILIGRLAYVQIVEGDTLTKKITSSKTMTVTGSTPRGMIYDAEGNALVSNQANAAITYTRGSQTTSAEIYKIALKLNQLIDMPVNDNLTTRDKKDFWLAKPANLKTAQNRLTAAEEKLDTSEQYKKMVADVTDEEINFSEDELKAATIFTNMNAASALNTVYVKNTDVSDSELAIVAENAAKLSGVSTGTDWTRSYDSNLDSSLKSILGTVSTETQGLPADELEKYLDQGYSRNDRVGTSYLEKEYESTLQGKKSKSKITLDNDGNVKSTKEISSGSKGDNLKLTINSQFQQSVEEIVKNNYQGLISSGIAQYSPGIYVVVTNPNNGDILSMVGYYHETGSSELQENALGAINNSFVPGSVVKAGTITAGYETGAISGNDTLIDEPIKIAGTAIKGSIYNKTTIGNQIQVNAVEALSWSSNSYMMKLVFKMLGVNYSYNMTLPSSFSSKESFEKLRSALGEYGMGVSTGIDLPNESTGIVNKDFGKSDGPTGGNLLDLSFGQYDTYTPLQLAQYAATVANGGTRISPHLVSGVYDNTEDGSLGNLIKEVTGENLGSVNISSEQMAIIRQGFYQVVHSSNAEATGRSLSAAALTTSAKTGTAETSVTVNGQLIETINSNLVAYAPSDNPQIALSVTIPNLNTSTSGVAKQIALEVINAYAAQFNVSG